MREWAKHLGDVLNLIIPMVWERLGKETRQGHCRINAPVLIEANLNPEDINFKTANESKCIFIATGSTPLQHKSMMKLCKEIEDHGRELHAYLPVLLGLGLNTMFDKITDEQLETYEGILKVDGDPREGQVLLNFDRVFRVLKEAIEEHNFEEPLLFENSAPIDRSSLTFFNNREVCTVCTV